MLRRKQCRRSNPSTTFLTAALTDDLIRSTWRGGEQTRGIPAQSSPSGWNYYLAPVEQRPGDTAAAGIDCLAFVSLVNRRAQYVSEYRSKSCRSRIALRYVGRERVFALPSATPSPAASQGADRTDGRRDQKSR